MYVIQLTIQKLTLIQILWVLQIFYNFCSISNVSHLLFASSSSVYGSNKVQPFSEDHSVITPLSYYAATKLCNEHMAYSYSHIHHLPTTGLRFFTVYGPWGRPDMALFKFTKAIIEGYPIDIYNNGDMFRDFTYIADIVKSISLLLCLPPSSGLTSQQDKQSCPSRILNIGSSSLLVF